MDFTHFDKKLMDIQQKINSNENLRRKIRNMGVVIPIQKKKNVKSGFVYFIKADSGKIKIGWSVDPIERLKTLQTGSPEILTLIGCIRGTREDEGVFHRMFKHYRLHCEWFSYDENLLEYIKERDCRNEYGIN